MALSPEAVMLYRGPLGNKLRPISLEEADALVGEGKAERLKARLYRTKDEIVGEDEDAPQVYQTRQLQAESPQAPKRRGRKPKANPVVAAED